MTDFRFDEPVGYSPQEKEKDEAGKSDILQKYYSRIHRRYDLVNSIFTFGLDKKWRLHTVKECLALSPSNVLDLCCGTGDLAITLCSLSRNSIPVTGYDLNAEMLEIARRKAVKASVTPSFFRGNVALMPFTDQQFDCITIGFGFRNLTYRNPDRDRHISEINRVLKTGGSLFILESSLPDNKLLTNLITLYLKYVLVPLGGILSGDWNAYRYLSGSSSGFYNFDQLKGLLGQFGFDLTLNRKFLLGSANLLVGKKIASE